MFRDIMLVIVIFAAFFMGYLFMGGVDRFFGNSGKWIKMMLEKNKALQEPKERPVKKEKAPDDAHFDRFFRRKIGGKQAIHDKKDGKPSRFVI